MPLPGTRSFLSAHFSAYRLVFISFISSCSVRAFRSVIALSAYHASPRQPFLGVGNFEGNFGPVKNREPNFHQAPRPPVCTGSETPWR